MSIIIKASVLYGPKDLRVMTRDLQPPAADEVQVAIQTTGICGSDLHYYTGYRNGNIQVKEPLTLGHESAGIVVAVGDNVTSLLVGDRVALEVGVPCQSCARCQENRYNICSKMRFRSSALAFPHAQGTLQERINHPAKWCHRLPSDMSLALAALVEPLSVAIHAVNRSGLQPGSAVLVFGAGTVGLLTAAVCKIRGAKSVVISDLDASRLELAQRLGFAHHVVLGTAKNSASIEEKLQAAREFASECTYVIKTPNRGPSLFDLTFECTGSPSCLQSSIYATCSGGKVMMVGMGSPIQTLPISAAALREVDLCGVFRYANAYPAAIEMLYASSPGCPDFSSLITHCFEGLEAVEDAFAMACRREDDQGNMVLKVITSLASPRS